MKGIAYVSGTNRRGKRFEVYITLRKHPTRRFKNKRKALRWAMANSCAVYEKGQVLTWEDVSDIRPVFIGI